MAQILFADKTLALAQGGGNVSIGAGSIVTIGGQQYTLSTSLSVAIPTLTAQQLYYVYAVATSGAVSLVISANINSVGPAGFLAWKMVAAFYANASATFDAFVSESGNTPSTFRNINTVTSGTYTPPTQATYLRIGLVGPGGGGAGSATQANNNGGSGQNGGNSTNTSFGTTIAVAGFGAGGGNSVSNGAAGGSNAFTTPFEVEENIVGGSGGGSQLSSNAVSGASGGNSALGGGGFGAGENKTGGNGAAGTGGGGGSGSFSNGTSSITGAGGGAGGFLKGIIRAPNIAGSYAFNVPAGGTNGGAGTGGNPGGSGANGSITIEEGKPNLAYLRTL